GCRGRPPPDGALPLLPAPTGRPRTSPPVPAPARPGPASPAGLRAAALRPPPAFHARRSFGFLQRNMDLGHGTATAGQPAQAEAGRGTVARRQLFAHVGQADAAAQAGLQAGAVIHHADAQAVAPCHGAHLDATGTRLRLDAVLDGVLD